MEFLRKNALNLLLIIILGVFSYLTVASRAPINMDEFSQYHPIICNHYEYNKLNIFREACGSYDLILPGTDSPLPLRSYGYGGSLASIYYYPLYLLWQSPESARMLGYLFILLQAFVLSKLLKQRFAYILIALTAFFPFMYQMLIDTGIVQFYTTAVFFIVYFLERWFQTRKNRYILYTGILLFLLLWSRLSFVFGIPALALLALVYAVRYFKSWKANWKMLLAGALVALLLMAVPTVWYFLSSSAWDRGSYPILEEAGRSSHELTALLDPRTYTERELLRRFFSPYEATSRAYEMPRIGIVPLIYSALLLLTPPVLLAFQLFKKWRRGAAVNLKALMHYGLFLLTAVFLFRSLDSYQMHHAIMAYPFLMLSWGYLLPDLKRYLGKSFLVFAVAFIGFNLYFFLSYTNNTINAYDHPSKQEVNAILSDEYLSRNYFYVVTDWGMYYYQGLYGPPEQSVLYIEDDEDDPVVMNTLADYPLRYGRSLLFIYDKTTPAIEDVRNYYPGLEECSLTRASEVWGILLPTDNSPLNPCH